MPDRAPLEIHETQEQGWTALKLTGELDLSTVPALQRRFETVRARSSAIQPDLSEIEFIDSSGMAFLIRASRRLPEARAGGSASIARSPDKSNAWCS
jgi:anti-anti-sigma factor